MKYLVNLQIITLGTAYHKFLNDLRESCETMEEYQIKKADRSLSPRRPDYNRLYASYIEDKYGARNGPEMFDALDTILEKYMEENPGSSSKLQRYEEREEESSKMIQPLILALVTPLMKRVHTMVSLFHSYK